MPKEESGNKFTQTLLTLLDETFDNVQGIFLDRGTSLFETLSSVSAEEASRPIIPGGTTIAAHTEHVRFYLQVTELFMQGKPPDKIDWKESWKVQNVTPAEWRALVLRLRDAQQRIVGVIEKIDDWNDEQRLGGALGVLSHTAYHLGAIRQIMRSGELARKAG